MSYVTIEAVDLDVGDLLLTMIDIFRVEAIELTGEQEVCAVEVTLRGASGNLRIYTYKPNTLLEVATNV